jgi:DNA-binding transcriptional ArsR family regulator
MPTGRLPRDTPRRQATLAEARAIAHPDRLRIIRLTFDAELTNKQLADALGKDPASTLHHVRTLLETGFLEALPPRRGARGAREQPYRSTGKSWTLDFGPDLDQGPAMVEALRAELAEAPPAQRRMTRLALRLTPDQLADLQARIKALVDEAASWEPVADGEPWALFIALHPRRVPGPR